MCRKNSCSLLVAITKTGKWREVEGREGKGRGLITRHPLSHKVLHYKQSASLSWSSTVIWLIMQWVKWGCFILFFNQLQECIQSSKSHLTFLCEMASKKEKWHSSTQPLMRLIFEMKSAWDLYQRTQSHFLDPSKKKKKKLPHFANISEQYCVFPGRPWGWERKLSLPITQVGGPTLILVLALSFETSWIINSKVWTIDCTKLLHQIKPGGKTHKSTQNTKGDVL